MSHEGSKSSPTPQELEALVSELRAKRPEDLTGLEKQFLKTLDAMDALKLQLEEANRALADMHNDRDDDSDGFTY